MDISPATRRRLAAVLELMSSDKEGERQAAAEAAHRLVRQAGARWADVIELEPSPSSKPSPRRQQPERDDEYHYARWDNWRTAAAACRLNAEHFTPWERRFLRSLAGFPRVSRKQSAMLHRLAARLDRTLTECGQ